MIIKGSSRAGPGQLARHLQRVDTNERVTIIQLDSPTGDLKEAFRDWQFLSTGTRGTKGLYHANIDPDARYRMAPEQWQRAVDVLEKELGLEGQPRAVVMHEKHGRQHIHIVWQRTDIDTMTLVADSYNYKAHERASLALEQEFGHEIVPGKHAKRDREKQPEMPKAEISHAEWQQGERAGIDPRAFKDAITQLYRRSDNGQALQIALAEHGLILAKGDRRDFVMLDQDGQIYSLARQIKGVTAKDLRAFMADLHPDGVPTVAEAKAQQAERSLPQPAPEIIAPKPDDERAKAEAALTARQEKETEKARSRQAAERTETARILDAEIAEKLNEQDAMQQAALDLYDRDQATKLQGFTSLAAFLKARFTPKQAAADQQERDEARDNFIFSQQASRQRQFEQWLAQKEAELKALSDRHAQQRRDQTTRFEEERARQARVLDADERHRRAEMEARRRRQEEELRAEQQRNRDGPPLGRAR